MKEKYVIQGYAYNLSMPSPFDTLIVKTDAYDIDFFVHE